MRISAPSSTKTVVKYDFVFSNQTVLPVEVDEAAGDSLVIDSEGIHLHLSEKPHAMNPSLDIPEEDYLINPNHLVWTRKMVVEVMDMTPEAKVEWQKTIQESGGGGVH